MTGGLPPLVREENAAAATYERLVERVRPRSAPSHWFPYDRVRVVNFIP